MSDADIVFKGVDGGSTITALTLDMSAAGAAAFNSYLTTTAVYGKDDANTGIQFDGSDVITLHTGGSQRMIIDNAGKIGIGTASPNAAEFSATPDGVLEIEGTKPVIYLSETDTTDAHGWLGVSNGVTYLGSTGSGLQLRTGTSSASTRMTIDTSGNVGIGATPSSNSGWNKYLSIKGGSSNAIVLDGTDSQEGAIGAVDGLYIDVTGHTTATNNKIIFRTQSANSNVNGIERMRITSDGQVNVSTGLMAMGTTSRSGGTSVGNLAIEYTCLLYTSPSPRD